MEKKFPGEEFEADRQCEMEFKSGFELCTYMVIPNIPRVIISKIF